ARGRRVSVRRRARRDARRSRRRPRRDRRHRDSRGAGPEQDRSRRPGAAPTPGEPVSRRTAGLGGERRGPGRAARTGRRAIRRAIRERPNAAPVRRGRASRRALRAWSSDPGAGRPAGRRLRPCAPAAARAAAVRALSPSGGARAAGALGQVIEVAIQRLREDAVVPARAYSGDAGLDLAACDRVELGPGERAVAPTGLAVAIPDGYAGFVQPRSGLASRHGISVVNAPGLIDSGYRGEIRVVLLNTDRREKFVVEPGMRIAQLVVLPVPELELVETEELPESERGVRGFGSSR